MIEPEVMARKLDNREGFKVVAYREVGLPVFRLNSLVTLQNAGQVGAIEEFVLRCIYQSLDTSTLIEVFLGLPPKIITHQLAQLLFENAIRQIESDPPRYQLTRVGSARLEGSSAASITKERLSIYVDGITRRVVPVVSQDLWSNGQLDQLGIAVVPPTPRRSPRASEVDLADINRMIALLAGADGPTRRAVRLDAVLGRVTVLFRRALALAFKSEDGRRVSIGYAIDGRESEAHEVEYARSPDVERSVLFGTMFNADQRRREVQAVARELRSDLPQIYADADRGKGGRSILRARKPVEVPLASASQKIRLLSVYDHPPLLKNAFDTAKRRLVLVSPWIRASVVDQEFIKRLAGCLERGVEVTIAYGIGKRDRNERPSDVTARESLAAIAKVFKNFRLVRKGDTHAKVLLVDDLFFVTTSFNWLSFRGDPRLPMREEEGTMVEDPVLVEGYYKRLSARIADLVDRDSDDA
jgi:hypothetical protein